METKERYVCQQAQRGRGRHQCRFGCRGSAQKPPKAARSCDRSQGRSNTQMSGSSCQEDGSGGAAARTSKKQNVNFVLPLSDSDRGKSTVDGFTLVVGRHVRRTPECNVPMSITRASLDCCISRPRPAKRTQRHCNHSLFQLRPSCPAGMGALPQSATVIVTTITRTIAIAGGRAAGLPGTRGEPRLKILTARAGGAALRARGPRPSETLN